MKDAQVGLPRADGFAVLVGHGFDDLLDMVEIVNDPGGEQVAQCDKTKIRVGAGKVELVFGEAEGYEGLEALGAQGGELIEQGVYGLARDEALEVEAVKGSEGGMPAFEDCACAGKPIGLVGEHEVADDVYGAEGVGGFSAVKPLRRFASKKSVEDGGSMRESLDGPVEIKLHG